MTNNKSLANKIEREKAFKYGMKQTIQSGANLWKGDMIDDNFMIDLKYTSAKTQCTIKKDDIEKMYEDACTYNPNKIPALLVSMDGYDIFCISPLDFIHYKELVEKERNNE
jgi:hypothetical protein